MSTYVLVPGAWLGAWAWREVAEDLRARGHAVYPLSLTGLGERAHLGGPQVDLETHVKDITGLIESEDLDDVILVGHSYAGMCPVPMAAHRVGDRLSHVVYVDCGPIDPGYGAIDEVDAATAARLREGAAAGDGWRMEFPPTDQLASEALRAGLTPQMLERMSRKASAHPFGAFSQPVQLKGEPAGKPAQVMIACADILALFAANNRWLVSLVGPDWQRFDIPTGHWPMLSTPARLAEILDQL